MQNKVLIIFFTIFSIIPFAFAELGSAKVTRYKGYVIIKSGKKVFRLKRRGYILKNGDFIQTKKGIAKLRFRDGARMTVRPFSSTRIGMKKKNGKKVRRVTCFAGKLWFKSGKKSKIKNFMQTPNMVCGLRGTEVEIGAFPKKRKIGVLTRFKGVVYLQSGKKVLRIRRKGVQIYANDRIQTKRGRVIITLHDGAKIKVRPFSRIRVQEKKEAGKMKRRVTCFSGKLWMKSGFSKKIKNYVQTPNMVCGLRGTEVEISAISKRRQVGRLVYIKGSVLLRSGRKILRIRRPGRIVYAGDHIQTRRGRAKVKFGDGAILKVRPFSSLLVQERRKKRKIRRRVTCFTGKLWFKSGKKSKIKNFMQTPNMVCGLRGTEVETGFNATSSQSMNNTLSGNTDIQGDVTRGSFDNPGESSAAASSVYSAYVTAEESGSFAAIQNAIDGSVNALGQNPSLEASTDAMQDMSTVSSDNNETYMSFDEGTYDELEGRPIEGTVTDAMIEEASSDNLAFSLGNDPSYNFQSDAAAMADNPSSIIREAANREIQEEPKNITSEGQVAIMEGNVDSEGSYKVVTSVDESSADNLEQSNVGKMLRLAEENPAFASAVGDIIDSIAENSTRQNALVDNTTVISNAEGDEGEGDEGEGDEGEGDEGEGDEGEGDEGEGDNDEAEGDEAEGDEGEGDEGEGDEAEGDEAEGNEAEESGDEGESDEGDAGSDEGDGPGDEADGASNEGDETGGDEGDGGGDSGGFNGGGYDASDAFEDLGDSAAESDIIENAS